MTPNHPLQKVARKSHPHRVSPSSRQAWSFRLLITEVDWSLVKPRTDCMLDLSQRIGGRPTLISLPSLIP